MNGDLWANVLACLVTLLAFIAARAIARLARGHALANPVLIGAILVAALLWALDIRVADYVIAARPLVSALDLAIVALAFVLVEGLRGKMRQLLPIFGALLIGGSFAMGSAIFAARLLGLPVDMVQALSVKGVSGGFAIALMERVGGPPPLAAGFVVATGMIGALTLPPLLKALRITGPESVGIATGQAAHIVGTDALIRRDPVAGAWAALAITIAGLLGALLLPLFLALFLPSVG